MALSDILAYLPLPNHIATSGQPTPAQFAEIRAAGYSHVINLATPSSSHWLANEADLVAAQGMDYTSIPVAWDYPTLDDLETLFECLAQPEKQPGDRPPKLWVHCALNLRVSAMMYLYHRLRLGMDDREATQYLIKLWTPNAVWQNFIDAALELHEA